MGSLHNTWWIQSQCHGDIFLVDTSQTIYTNSNVELNGFFHLFTPILLLFGMTQSLTYVKLSYYHKSKTRSLKTIQPTKNSIFNVHDPEGISFLFQLRVGLSPLKAHKKKHNFIDTPVDDCCCGTGTETTEHFLVFVLTLELSDSFYLQIQNSSSQNQMVQMLSNKTAYLKH